MIRTHLISSTKTLRRSSVIAARSLSTLTHSNISAAPIQRPATLSRPLDGSTQNDLAYCLSFSNDGSAFSSHWVLSPDDLMLQQLAHSQKHRYTKPFESNQEPPRFEQQPLPRTLLDAFRDDESRAIVVTEAVKPFRIVAVNTAWEDLCGYTSSQAHQKTLGSLLQGPDTDTVAATGLIAKLLDGESEAGAILINYTARGRCFRNRVRVGPIYEDSDSRNVTNFVGVLQEMQEESL